ncbi:MAG TPA: hypothetical protein VFI12_05460 [Thermomicrobiales bacterium]|nr:hypothetical protein [Thermomicrobiales bacterium]
MHSVLLTACLDRTWPNLAHTSDCRVGVHALGGQPRRYDCARAPQTAAAMDGDRIPFGVTLGYGSDCRVEDGRRWRGKVSNRQMDLLDAEGAQCSRIVTPAGKVDDAPDSHAGQPIEPGLPGGVGADYQEAGYDPVALVSPHDCLQYRVYVHLTLPL